MRGMKSADVITENSKSESQRNSEPSEADEDSRRNRFERCRQSWRRWWGSARGSCQPAKFVFDPARVAEVEMAKDEKPEPWVENF